MLGPDDRRQLLEILTEARDLGFLGPGPVADHIERSLAFVVAWEQARPPPDQPAPTAPLAAANEPGPGRAGMPTGSGPAATTLHLAGRDPSGADAEDRGPTSLLDLGSGGGVPGLVLALVWTDCAVTLLDAGHRRTDFLGSAVERLGLDGRVEVINDRAETAARGRLRGRFALVTARGFAPPAVTAECAAPLLAPGGWLAVAEPPGGSGERWPDDAVRALGLARAGSVTRPAAVQLLRRVGDVPDRFPRRVGIPAKRPLWS